MREGKRRKERSRGGEEREERGQVKVYRGKCPCGGGGWVTTIVGGK